MRPLWAVAATTAAFTFTGAAAAPPVPAGAKYVAMGSSFAAGPRVTQSADTPSNRCARSADNYARQLARKRGLALTDVSCSGSTTAHILGPWRDLPPEIDAVDAATRLVTITIGGNDLGYMGVLGAATCKAAGGTDCNAAPGVPTDQAYADLQARLTDIARAVKARAPHARLIFVQYFTVLPPQGTCAALPMTPAEADAARALAHRLADVTARAAKAGGAEVLALGRLSANHNACANTPWINGVLTPGALTDGAAFHPKLAGMTAAAEALDRMLK